MRTYGDLPFVKKKGAKPMQGFWCKAVEQILDKQTLHQKMLAYISDFRLMASALKPHGITYDDSNVFAASIDHALWIHREVKVDEWIYYDMVGPSATGCKGLNFGHFYDVEGRLIASTAQESLIRVKA